jgi:sugar O-acyltransferase (sialic acid O-acetyltransferase NeuD family)
MSNEKSSKLIILGASDLARLALINFRDHSNYDVVAFAVDREYRKMDSLLDLPVVDTESISDKFSPSKFSVFVAIGYSNINRLRAAACKRMKGLGYSLASFVSPFCTYLSEHQVGENTFIFEDNTVQPFVKIGSNVIIWSGNHIGHDVTIEDDCFITSHVVISGHCKIGRGSFLGVNATLRNDIKIGVETIVGAGAIIMKDTEDNSVWVPERAKLFPKRSDMMEI